MIKASTYCTLNSVAWSAASGGVTLLLGQPYWAAVALLGLVPGYLFGLCCWLLVDP